MKLTEGLLGFSGSDYRAKISSREYSYAELATNIYRKRRAIVTSEVSAVCGVVAAHVTGGTSLVGSAWSARNISVEMKKLRLLEEEWARRGQHPLPERTIKDTIIPVLITGAIGVFAFYVDLSMAELTAEAAQAAAQGIPGCEFQGHLVGAIYTVVEKSVAKLGDTLNTLSSVSDTLLREQSTYLPCIYRYNGGGYGDNWGGNGYHF